MAYATLAEIKSWLSISGSDNDTMLTALAEVAQTALDGVMERSLEQATATEKYWGNNSKHIFVRRTPVTAVTAVSFNAAGVSTTVAIGDIDFDDQSIFWNLGMFRPIDRVSITYTAGYATAPTPVRQAMLMTVQALWNAQAADPNLTGDNLQGVVSGSYDQFGPGSVPRAARSLINQYTARYVML